MINSDSSNDEVITGLLSFLQGQPAHMQLDFWVKFRDKHRTRIANTEAVLCPELLNAVDAQIESLRAILNAGG